MTSLRLVSIADEIAPFRSGVDGAGIAFAWFPVLINRLRIVPFNLGSIVAIDIDS